MESLFLQQDNNGVLKLHTTKWQDVEVIPVRCFPWSAASQFISLCDENGEELILLDDLAELDKVSRHAVEQSLTASSFIFQITHIYKIDTEFEIRNWHVMTQQGEITFQSNLDEWPQPMAGMGLVIKDVAGNLLCIKNVEMLDTKSRDILWPYLD